MSISSSISIQHAVIRYEIPAGHNCVGGCHGPISGGKMPFPGEMKPVPLPGGSGEDRISHWPNVPGDGSFVPLPDVPGGSGEDRISHWPNVPGDGSVVPLPGIPGGSGEGKIVPLPGVVGAVTDNALQHLRGVDNALSAEPGGVLSGVQLGGVAGAALQGLEGGGIGSGIAEALAEPKGLGELPVVEDLLAGASGQQVAKGLGF